MDAHHCNDRTRTRTHRIVNRGRRRLAISSLLVAFALIAPVSPLSAQTVENPTSVEFDPSPDHNASQGGTPLVDRYEMDFFVQATGQLVRTVALGKPAPAGTGRIKVNFAALLSPPLPTGTIYTASVAAVGSGGRASSTVAPDTFLFSAPCSFTVSPTNPSSLPAGGGNASVSVSATSGCAWTASEASSWLSITSSSSGTGNGTVSYAAEPNTTTSSRSATLTVAGQTVTVTQSAASCGFTVTPTNPAVLPAGGGSASVTVSTTSGCAWTASEASSWLSITSGSSGTGNGTVNYTATANTTTSSRSASMTVAGQTVTVTQNAASCSFTVSPASLAFGAASGSASILVTTTSGCAWTATESASWLSITSGSSGTGGSPVTIAVTGNTTGSSRSTTLTVAGQSVVITQFAAIPGTPTNVRVTVPGGL